jgi:D-xylose transport system ATP-binding protein
MPLLELESITKEFPGVLALDRVSFDLEAREIHVLCGENGAGKSTLIKVLSGFYPYGTYRGEVRLRSEPARFADIRAAERHGIAVIAQELALVPEMSVAENLMLGREPVSRGLIQWDRLRTAAREALARAGCDVDPDAPVRTLGVGQQQMVEIAKALDKRSQILVLDEPTAALTESDAQRLLGRLRLLRESGVSSIYISHRLEEIFAIADRITVLRDGRVIATAPARDWTPDRVIGAMVGREIRNLHSRPETETGGIALAVEDWRVEDPANPGRLVLDRVAFDVRKGEVLGIAGLMGSGRTALVSSLFGAGRASVAGRIAVPGRASRAPFRHPAEAIGAGLALVGEDRKRQGLVPNASILENLTLPTLKRFRRGLLLDDGARSRESQAQVEALGIRTASLSARVADLSGGTQQKVVLGKWLLAKPRVLLLDEPTRGIDVGSKAEIHRIVGRLAQEGVAIVLVSSDLPELLGLSHRVLVLCEGRQTATLSRSHATPEAVMAAATHGARQARA